MRLKMVATAAFAAFLMSAFSLCAQQAAKPSMGVTGDSTVASSAVPEPPYAVPAAPATEALMEAAYPYSEGPNNRVPRFELFAGYSYLRAVPTMAAGNRLVWLNGGTASIALNVNRYLGLVADFGAFTNSQIRFTGAYNSTVDVDNSNVAVLTYLFGPRLSFRNHDRITPFAQVLFGGVHANQVTLDGCAFSCTLLPDQDAFAMTAGGGLDLRVHHHFAIRIIQAEYLMTRFTNYTTGDSGGQNDIRLSSGIVFRFGGHRAPPLPPPQPLSYSCSVNPSSVYPGEPIAASGTAVSLDPAKTADYTWSVDAGKVTGGTSSSASIDTANVAPGSYTLKGRVSQGNLPAQNADCSATYTVKPFEPPTVSCSANPLTVDSGGSSTITAIGVSPQNRPLTYSYNSTSGSIGGSGSTATLSAVGASTGPISVTCNVTDDLGRTASAATSVTVEVPAAAPRPVASQLCSLHFDRDPRRPARVDNEGKACLDEVAINLQRNSDAGLAMIGNAASRERNSKKLAALRAANAKAYLVSEKGISASRITLYAGSDDGKSVSITLIPAGAAFDASGQTPVN